MADAINLEEPPATTFSSFQHSAFSCQLLAVSCPLSNQLLPRLCPDDVLRRRADWIRILSKMRNAAALRFGRDLLQ